MKATMISDAPFVLFLDAENMGPDMVAEAEKEIKNKNLYVRERRAYERSNQKISKEFRGYLKSMGYSFVDIGKTHQKDAVDNAIKMGMWECFERYQRNLILLSQDGGYSGLIKDLNHQGANIILPRTRNLSKKLKGLKSKSDRIVDRQKTLNKMSSTLVSDEIARLESELGEWPEAAFRGLPAQDQQDLAKGLIDAIRKSPSLQVQGWIYTEHLAHMVGQQWASTFTRYLKDNANQYNLSFSIHSSKEFPIFADLSLNERETAVESKKTRRKIASVIAERFGDKVIASPELNQMKQVRKFLKDMMPVDEDIRVFGSMFGDLGDAASMVRECLEENGLAQRARHSSPSRKDTIGTGPP